MSSRTSKSIANSMVGIVCSLMSSLLGFALQAVFIRLLGLEYSGINSLFTNILSMLNIAELGVSNAILFRLYKQIADKSEEGIALYMATYKRICYVVAAIIGILGVCCIPFLEHLVNEIPQFPESLWSLFVVVLVTSVVQHGMDYKNIYIIAKQDRYILTIVNYATQFACYGLQILVLFVCKNIYLYLSVKLGTTIVKGIWTGYITKHKYGVRWSAKLSLPRAEQKQLAKDVGSLATYKFCRTLDATIDTFVISKFIDVATTAIYGSINMLLNAVNELLGQFNDGMLASIGNLYALGDKKRVSSVFYQAYHFTFLLYGIVTATFVPFLYAFSEWWIGYSLPLPCIYVMLMNFFMYGLGMNVATFRNSMGIFTKGWKRPAITALLNLIFSVLLAQKLGLIGTLYGTLLARTLTLVWYDPFIVIKYGMNEKPWKYYFRYGLYLVFTIVVSGCLMRTRCFLPPMDDFISLLWQGMLLGIEAVFLFLALGCLIPEQKMILKRAFNIGKNFVNKLMHRKQQCLIGEENEDRGINGKNRG